MMHQELILEKLDLLAKAQEHDSNLIKRIFNSFCPNDDVYLSSGEVERLLHKTRRTLHNWTQRGFLIVRKIGGTNYYRKLDILGLLGDHELKRETVVGKVGNNPGKVVNQCVGY